MRSEGRVIGVTTGSGGGNGHRDVRQSSLSSMQAAPGQKSYELSADSEAMKAHMAFRTGAQTYALTAATWAREHLTRSAAERMKEFIFCRTRPPCTSGFFDPFLVCPSPPDGLSKTWTRNRSRHT